jgi:hypothetical protein
MFIMWALKSCSPTDYRRFGGIYCFPLDSINLCVFCFMLFFFFFAAWRYISDDFALSRNPKLLSILCKYAYNLTDLPISRRLFRPSYGIKPQWGNVTAAAKRNKLVPRCEAEKWRRDTKATSLNLHYWNSIQYESTLQEFHSQLLFI